MNKKICPLVSVIIPTYNNAGQLGRAIESVVHQSYHNWEIIVIDNNSSDETYEVVNAFRNSKIRYFTIHNNGIVAASRNRGMIESRGDWIAFLDSDDFWFQNKLKVQIELLDKNQEADVLIHDEIRLNLDEKKSRNLIYGPGSNKFYLQLLKYGNCLSPSAVIIKKNFLRMRKIQFSELSKFNTSEDYDFWLRLAKNGAKLRFHHVRLGCYTIHGKNLSSNKVRHFDAIREVLESHISQVENLGVRQNLTKYVATRIYISEFISHLGSHHYMLALDSLGSAFKLSFRNTLHYLTYLITCYFLKTPHLIYWLTTDYLALVLLGSKKVEIK